MGFSDILNVFLGGVVVGAILVMWFLTALSRASNNRRE